MASKLYDVSLIKKYIARALTKGFAMNDVGKPYGSATVNNSQDITLTLDDGSTWAVYAYRRN